MRLRSALLVAAIATSLWPWSVRAQDARPLRPVNQIVLSGSVTVARGERVGEVLVLSGRVTVHGVVTGDVVVLEGPVAVTGQVNGSVIVADGIVRLAESARVGGDVSSSEEVAARPGAEVGGETRGDVRFSLRAPLAALGDLLGPVAIAVSVGLAGLVLLLLAPRGAETVAAAMSGAPLASLGWGFLVAIAVPVAAIALVVSVLGLPLGLTLFLSTGLWWLIGLVWAAWGVGRGLVRPPGGRGRAFAAGWAIVAAVGLVPILNVAVWTLAPILGLGAMVVAVWRARQGGGRHRPGALVSHDEAVQVGSA